MINIKDVIVSAYPPKHTECMWLQPTNNGTHTYKLRVFGDLGWTNDIYFPKTNSTSTISLETLEDASIRASIKTKSISKSLLNQELQDFVDGAAMSENVYTKEQMYTKTETYTKAEVKTKVDAMFTTVDNGDGTFTLQINNFVL